MSARGAHGGVGNTAACHDDVCITCSDTAVEAVVCELLGDELALVDAGAGLEEVSIALVAAQVGDAVLVHAGEAIARVAHRHVSRGCDGYDQ